MSTKPTQTPEWATDGGDRIVEPSSGKKELGWEPGEEPAAEVQNWLHELTNQWIEWLDGIADADGDWSDKSFSGTDYVGTTEGDIRHGETSFLIPPSMGEAKDATTPWTFFGTAWQSGGGAAAGTAVWFAIPLQIGDRIKAVHGYILDDTGKNIEMKVWKRTSLGAGGTPTSGQLGSTQTSAGDATQQTLSVTGLTETTVDNAFYTVEFIDQDGTTSGLFVHAIKVVVDRVA